MGVEERTAGLLPRLESGRAQVHGEGARRVRVLARSSRRQAPGESCLAAVNYYTRGLDEELNEIVEIKRRVLLDILFTAIDIFLYLY